MSDSVSRIQRRVTDTNAVEKDMDSVVVSASAYSQVAWPWFNTWSGQACYIWCKNLALNIAIGRWDYVSLVNWRITLMPVQSQFGM